MSRLYLVWGALVAMGCGRPPGEGVIETTFDPCMAVVVPDFDTLPHELAALDTALTHWNLTASLRLRRDDGATAGDAAFVIPIRFGSGGFSYGFYDDRRGEVFINRQLHAEQQPYIVAHELGHAFGLLHVDSKRERSVMNPGRVRVWPTLQDVARVHALWGRCDEAT